MKFTFSIFAALLALLTVGLAADPDPNDVPSCAAECIQTVLASSSTCSATDITCICNDKEYNNELAACVTAACTVKESLIATRLNARQCGIPIKPRSKIMIVTRAVFMGLTSAFVAIRIWVRTKKLGGHWWWDDYTILLAYAIAIGYFADNFFVTKHGLGTDMYDLSFYDITKFFYTFYIIALLYKFQMSLAKISVCLFFLRIFPSRSFRIYATIFIVLNATVGLLFMFIDAFQCMPIKAAWEGWAKEIDAKCINFPAVALANGIVNIILDVCILSLPIYEVTKLNLSRRKKFNIAVMFSFGFVLTIVGILRSEEFSHHLKSSNPTVDMEPLHYWSLIECDLSVICACLPDTRALLLSLFPNFFRSTRTGSEYVSGSNLNTFTKGSTGRPKGHDISMTTTFQVEYSTKPNTGDTESFVELVNIYNKSPGKEREWSD